MIYLIINATAPFLVQIQTHSHASDIIYPYP